VVQTYIPDSCLEDGDRFQKQVYLIPLLNPIAHGLAYRHGVSVELLEISSSVSLTVGDC
jgi:hypothetical protein